MQETAFSLFLGGFLLLITRSLRRCAQVHILPQGRFLIRIPDPRRGWLSRGNLFSNIQLENHLPLFVAEIRPSSVLVALGVLCEKAVAMQLPPASVISSWPKANYVSPVTRGPESTVVASSLLGVATIIILLRLYTRQWMLNGLMLDDLFIILAYVSGDIFLYTSLHGNG